MLPHEWTVLWCWTLLSTQTNCGSMLFGVGAGFVCETVVEKSCSVPYSCRLFEKLGRTQFSWIIFNMHFFICSANWIEKYLIHYFKILNICARLPWSQLGYHGASLAWWLLSICFWNKRVLSPICHRNRFAPKRSEKLNRECFESAIGIYHQISKSSRAISIKSLVTTQ